MIIDDVDPVQSQTPAPKTGAAFVSILDRIANANLSDSDRTRLMARAIDARQAAESALSSLETAVESVRGNARAHFRTARDSLLYLSGLYRGNATRVSQEAVDSLAKIAINAQANARRRSQFADQLLWQTPARPVASRSETALLSTLDPVDAAEAMVASRAELAESLSTPEATAGIESLQPGGGEAGPTDSEVISAAIEFGTSLRTPVIGSGSVSAVSPIGGSTGGLFDPPQGCEIGDNAGDRAYLHPGTNWNGITTTTTPPDYLKDILDLAKANGATILFSPLLPPSGTNSLWLGDVSAYFPDGSSFTYGLTFGKLNPGQSQDDPWNHFPGYPEDYLPVHIRSASLVTCHPPAPVPPPVSPPPPPPPPGESPPPPDSIGPACCPPDPLERNDGKAELPFPPFEVSKLPSLTWCEYVDYVLDHVADFGGGSGEGGGGTNPDGSPKKGFWADVFGTTPQGFTFNLLKDWAFGSKPVAGSPAENTVNSMIYNNSFVHAYGPKLKANDEQHQGKIAPLLGTLSLMGWAERFTGAPIKQLATPYQQALNYLCPVDLPDQASIDSLYLSGGATDEDWRCMTQSLGNIPGIARRVRDAKRTTLNSSEHVDLWMRRKIDFPDLEQRLRFLGVTDDATIREWIELRNQIPQFADIIRFMVRDTENPQVVAQGRLTDGFDVNFQGQLRDWAEQQGISDELALKFWIAHWDLPSPTMAFEMLKRLRPGRVPDELTVTKDQVQSLLSAADYAPGWRDKMIAISYLTPTRTDIKQGYARGVYDRATILEMLQDTGLDKDGAEAVAKLYDYEKSQFQRTRTEKNSAFTVKTILAAFIAGTLNRKESETLLEEFGFSPERMKTLLDSADLRAVVATREKCIRSVRRRYFVGAINEVTAVKELTDRDIDIGQAEDLVQGWDCERRANLQEVPARKNLQWAVDGVITVLELGERLERLRYSPEDVTRYIQEAEKRISDAVAKAAEKQIRDLLAENRRKLAEAKARLKEFENRIKEAEKKAKEAEKGSGKG